MRLKAFDKADENNVNRAKRRASRCREKTQRDKIAKRDRMERGEDSVPPASSASGINPQTYRLTSGEQFQVATVKFVVLMSGATSIAERKAISDQVLSKTETTRDSLIKNAIPLVPEPTISRPGQNRQEKTVKIAHPNPAEVDPNLRESL